MGSSNIESAPDDEPLDPADERLLVLLSDYQEALTAGRTDGPADFPLPDQDPRLVREFEQGRRVLEGLEDVRREFADSHSPGGDTATKALTRHPDALESADISADDPLPPNIGRFEIIRELGRGGLGVVFLARDPVLTRDVALKIPRPEALLTPDLRRRFAREAQAAARLTHPNLVAVHEVGEAGPVCYLAAAFSKGQNLAAWIEERKKPVSVAIAAQIMVQLADGIEYAHQQGVLHRDLKPSNVLLEERGGALPADVTARDGFSLIPKITDFGLARVADLAASETRTGLVMGTPGYMAPEQAEGRTRDIGPATDVYALGAILYELVTGQPLLKGATDVDTLRRVVSDEPCRPRRLRFDLPRDLEAICLKCLEKQPARRYASAGALAADLRQFSRGEPTQARAIGGLGRLWRWARRRPMAAALLAVTMLATVLLMVGTLVHTSRVTALYLLAEENRREAESQRSEAESQRQRAETRQAEAQSLVRDLRREVYVKDMGRALQTWQQGDAQQAIAFLNTYLPKAGEEDLRGFEWYHSMRRFKDQGRTLLGHFGPVYHVAVSPHGTLVASAGGDGRIQLWNTDGWKIRATLGGHKQAVKWISFSPNGAQLASASDDGTARIWNVSTRESRTVIRCDGKVAAAAYTPDGQTLIVATRDGHISLFDTQDWTARSSFDCFGTVESLALAPDGKELTIVFDVRPAEQWDLTTTPPTRLAETLQARMPQLERRYTVKYLPDGQNLVAGTNFGLLGFLPRVGPLPKEPHTRHLRSKSVDAIAVAPDGRTLAVASAEGVVRLIDTATLEELQTLVGHRGPVWSVAWLPDGEGLVSASEDGTTKVWRPQQSVEVGDLLCELPFTAGSSSICTPLLKFNADAQQVWFGTVEGVWKIDLATRKVTRRLAASTTSGEFYDVSYALGQGSDRVMVCSENGLRQVWELATERVIFTVPLDEEQLPRLRESFGGPHAYFAGISNDGRQVVAAEPAGDISVWNVDTGERMLRLSKRYAEPAFYSRFSPDDRLIVVATQGAFDLFDAATGAQLTECKDSQTPVFSPDGRFFIREVEGRNNRLQLARSDQLRTGVRDLQLPTVGETVLAITHDGRTFATIRPAGAHGELCLWSATVGQPMIALAANCPENIMAAAFSPDGSMLATLSSYFDQLKVLLWRANSPDSAVRKTSANSGLD